MVMMIMITNLNGSATVERARTQVNGETGNSNPSHTQTP